MNRRTLLRWLGLAPAVAVASRATGLSTSAPRPESADDLIVALPVIVQRGCYQCSACADVLRFNPIPFGQFQKLTHAIAVCGNRRCPQHGLQLSVPLERMTCEIVGRELEI